MKNLSGLSKIKIAVVSILIGWIGISQTYAQQEAQYSQYMFNMLSVNPAYAGSRDVLSLTGLFRQQWVNIPGAPQTISFWRETAWYRELWNQDWYIHWCCYIRQLRIVR